MPGPEANPSAIPFPAGPTYSDLLASDHGPDWVRYKVWSSDWYTATLERLWDDLGDLQSNVGVEMALDGALSGLSGAFDAAVALMISSAEDSLEFAEDERLRVHQYTWPSFKKVAKGKKGRTGVDRRKFPSLSALEGEIDAALEGHRDDDPVGWLAVLRRFRNVPAHQRALSRTWSVDVGESSDVTLTGIPGGDAVAYLKESCNQISDLTEAMISAANSFGYVGANTPLARQPWVLST